MQDVVFIFESEQDTMPAKMRALAEAGAAHYVAPCGQERESLTHCIATLAAGDYLHLANFSSVAESSSGLLVFLLQMQYIGINLVFYEEDFWFSSTADDRSEAVISTLKAVVLWEKKKDLGNPEY